MFFLFHKIFSYFWKLNFGINDSLFMRKSNIFIGQIRNLDMLEEKIPSVLEEAKKKEVNRIITIATDQRSSEKVCNYVKSYSNIYGTVGIHPHEAKSVQQTDYDFIATSLVKEKKIIALGECML